MSLGGSYAVFPFVTPSDNSVSEWFSWDTTDDLVIAFPSALAIASLWFPTLTSAVSIYIGTTATGTPIYTTGSSGAELVPIEASVLAVTLHATSGTMPVFASSIPFDPTRSGPSTDGVLSITVAEPIVNTGTDENPIIGLDVPLAIEYGGTGTDAPSLIGGSNVNITGDWPNQTISSTAGGTVTAVTASAPLVSSGGNAPNLSISTPIAKSFGGTGTTTPGLTAGSLIGLTGAWPNNTISVLMALFGLGTPVVGDPLKVYFVQVTCSASVGPDGNYSVSLSTSSVGFVGSSPAVFVTPLQFDIYSSGFIPIATIHQDTVTGYTVSGNAASLVVNVLFVGI